MTNGFRRAIVLAAATLGTAGATVPARAAEPDDPFSACRALSPGVNLGNALEAPREGEWGVTLQESYFDEIARAGFKSVRVPIRWSAHAAAESPSAIDAELLARVDWVLKQSVPRGLTTVINIHHYGEMDQSPEKHLPRLIALWKQIAERYRDQPDSVYFELLNEPHDKLTDELWQRMFPQVLATVRESNPRRYVIIGPGHWNNVNHLAALSLPENDRRLIATFHYYNPFEFTHQGAEWVPDSGRWKGRTWTGSPDELAALRKDLRTAADWGRRHDRPLYLGEFGAYRLAPLESRVAWTQAVAREAEALGIAWCYWEFCSGFGLFDPATDRWRQPLRDALLPRGAALGPGDHLIRLTVDGRPRQYRVHVPPQYDPSQPAPLVLAFHGSTMNARMMATFSGLSAKSDEAGFVVAYPNGTGPRDLLVEFNAGEELDPPPETRPDDVKYTAALLDDLALRLRIDPRRVYATGMSNGGMMSYRLAAELPERFAAIAPVAGTMPAAARRPAQPMPVLHLHGTADAIVPYHGPDENTPESVRYLSVDETARLWAAANGCSLAPETTELPDLANDGTTVIRHTYCAGEGTAEVVIYEIRGGGHTWPGSDTILRKTLGRATRDISANDVIWDFFQRHARPE